MSESILSPQPPGPDRKVPILIGVVLALVGATAYQFYQVNQLRTELNAQLTETRDLLINQIGRVNETSSVSTQTAKRSMDTLKSQVIEARQHAQLLAG